MLKVTIGVLMIMIGIALCSQGYLSGIAVFLLGVLWVKEDEDDSNGGGQGEIAWF